MLNLLNQNKTDKQDQNIRESQHKVLEDVIEEDPDEEENTSDKESSNNKNK